MAAAEKREVFQASREKGMIPFITEASRPHLNEAALCRGEIELEAMEAAQSRKRNPEKDPSVHDSVLQRALDLVTSLAVLQKK